MGCDVLIWAALLAPGPEIPVFCCYARDLRYRGPAIAADCRLPRGAACEAHCAAFAAKDSYNQSGYLSLDGQDE